MTSGSTAQPSSTPREGLFAATRWSVVLAARGDTPQAKQALEQLCQVYWPAIYAYLRRTGRSPHDAQDLTQEFFSRLIEREAFGSVDRSRGRFRSFLLASLKNFLSNEWDRARAQKRGGGAAFISIDTASAETTLGLVDGVSADKLFERRWATALLDRVMARLRGEYVGQGREAVFEALKNTLLGERTAVPYAQIARQLGSTEGAVKVAVHRLRQRYRELLREEIAETVAGPEDVEEELRNLFAVFL